MQPFPHTIYSGSCTPTLGISVMEFNYHVMKIQLKVGNHDMGLSTQQTFGFSPPPPAPPPAPDVLARVGKIPVMTMVSTNSDWGCLSLLECSLQTL